MKTIPLTKGKVALVDDADYGALSRFRWHTLQHGGGKFYAVRAGTTVGTKRRMITMHAHLAGTPAGMVTDHVNGDSLDNRRSNLRVCTQSENLANRGKSKNNTSGYKGVTRDWRSIKNPWVAQIWKLNRRIHLGVFPTAEAAARAYDEAALKLHGEFAFLNFPLK